MDEQREPTERDVQALLDAALAQVGRKSDAAQVESWDIDRHGLTHSYHCCYLIHGRWYDGFVMVGPHGELPPLALIVERMQAQLADDATEAAR